MFNCYYVPARVEVKYTPAKVCITECVVAQGDSLVSVPSSHVRLVNDQILFRAVTPSQRMKEGSLSPAASNYLVPSLEEYQKVSRILSQIDDKYSYDALMEKAAAARAAALNPEPAPEPNPEPTK